MTITGPAGAMAEMVQNVGTPPVELKQPQALKELEEFYDEVVKHNNEIKVQIGLIDGVADALHGQSAVGPDDAPPETQPSGVLGHIRFALTEQARLLEVLLKVIARL